MWVRRRVAAEACWREGLPCGAGSQTATWSGFILHEQVPRYQQHLWRCVDWSWFQRAPFLGAAGSLWWSGCPDPKLGIICTSGFHSWTKRTCKYRWHRLRGCHFVPFEYIILALSVSSLLHPVAVFYLTTSIGRTFSSFSVSFFCSGSPLLLQTTNSIVHSWRSCARRTRLVLGSWYWTTHRIQQERLYLPRNWNLLLSAAASMGLSSFRTRYTAKFITLATTRVLLQCTQKEL